MPTNMELINDAQGVLNPHTVGGRLFGNVSSMLVTDTARRPMRPVGHVRFD